MRTTVGGYLDEVLQDARRVTGGRPADYIPELEHADPELLGVALTTADGVTYASGAAEVAFTIQSVSKPFVYALALEHLGQDAVEERVGVEPSGEAFNELSLEEVTKRPYNPMINAGAIATHALLGGPDLTGSGRDEAVLAGLSAFAGRPLEVDERVHASEMATAHRNFSLAHMLEHYGILVTDAHSAVRGYTRQCAVAVTTRDLSVMAATLANGGTNPVTGERVVSADVVRHTLSVMLACGMYDAAGDWITEIGIPAKSGVGGGLIGALPGQMGVASFSPPLDPHGTSLRGLRIFERLSHEFGLHLMSVPPLTRSVLRDRTVVQLDDAPTAAVYELQGPLRFSSLEQVVRMIETDPPAHRTVVIDTTSSTSADATAGRMLRELLEHLLADGREAWFVGPAGLLGPEGPPDAVRLASSFDDLLRQG